VKQGMGDRLIEIEERWAAVTPGIRQATEDEYDFGIDGRVLVTTALKAIRVIAQFNSHFEHSADIAAFASAPEDVAWLVAEVKRQAEELRLWRVSPNGECPSQHGMVDSEDCISCDKCWANAMRARQEAQP